MQFYHVIFTDATNATSDLQTLNTKKIREISIKNQMEKSREICRVVT